MTNKYYKGIDDLLAAGLQPQRLDSEQSRVWLSQVRAELFPESPLPDQELSHEPPIPLECSPSPFPLEVFPESLAGILERYARSLNCPTDFVGAAALAVSSAAIGAARSIKLKGGWYEKPSLYVVLVAEPGTAKSPALRALMEPLYDEQTRLFQQYKADREQYEQELEDYKNALKNPPGEGEELEKPKEPAPMRHVYANDTTVECLGANLAENLKGMLVFRDELSGWIKSMDMYRGKGADRQFFLSAWSGETVKVDRKNQQGQPLVIPHPFISVLGGIQPDLLDVLQAEKGQQDGFLDRLLFCYPRHSIDLRWQETEISECDQQQWKQIVARLLNMQLISLENQVNLVPRPLSFLPAAKERFREWFDALQQKADRENFNCQERGTYSKIRAYCARFALILHLLRFVCEGQDGEEDSIALADVEGAIQLAEYFLSHAHEVQGRMHQHPDDPRVATLLEWMRRKNKRSCTPRDIYRNHVCNIKTASEAEKLLRAAIDRGYGLEVQPAGRGRGKTGCMEAFQLHEKL